MSNKVKFSPGTFFHGTKANLNIGDYLEPGHSSNFDNGRISKYIYFTGTLDAAIWGAELAKGKLKERIYIVEPTGDFEDDPNVTNKRFKGNPTKSYRTKYPLKIVAEAINWKGHSQEALDAMLDNLRKINDSGIKAIE